MQADGLSLDDKRQPVKDNDIDDIRQRWQNLDKEKKRKRTDKSFFVSLKDIHDNGYDLSINRYKEVVHEEKKYEKPSIIIKSIKTIDEERRLALKELEKLLE